MTDNNENFVRELLEFRERFNKSLEQFAAAYAQATNIRPEDCELLIRQGESEMSYTFQRKREPTFTLKMFPDEATVRSLIVKHTCVCPDSLSVLGYDKAARAIVEYLAALPCVAQAPPCKTESCPDCGVAQPLNWAECDSCGRRR